MNIQNINQYLVMLENDFGRDNLLRILSGEKMKPDPSSSPSRLHQQRLKSYVQEHLSSFGNTSIRKIAEECYKLTEKIEKEISDPKISTKLQEFIEAVTKEHTIGGLEYYLNDLNKKKKPKKHFVTLRGWVNKK